eukprot:749770-Hanusia_phi.AAC.7
MIGKDVVILGVEIVMIGMEMVMIDTEKEEDRGSDVDGLTVTILAEMCPCSQEAYNSSRWDEASEVLAKALELEPKSKEISSMMRDVNRKSEPKGTAEQGERKKEESKKSGLKLVAGGDSKTSEKETTSVAFQPIGFSESIIEQFVKDSLTNVITQFSQQGCPLSPPLLLLLSLRPYRRGEVYRLHAAIEAGGSAADDRHRGGV